MRIAVAGMPDSAAFKMRGLPLIERYGYERIDLTKWTGRGQWDVLLLIKRANDKADLIRKSCSRLIHDPLDIWLHVSQSRTGSFWDSQRRLIQPTELIGTSPSCVEVMKTTGSPVHFIPHAADPRLDATWYDPNGPIVYYGFPLFISAGMGQIAYGAEQISRKFRVYNPLLDPIDVLRHAALHICLRQHPFSSPLNRRCKPQVKLENAAACGAPVIASRHPCITSLRPEAYTVEDVDATKEHGRKWRNYLTEALESPPLTNPYTLNQYCEEMRKVLER